MTSNSPMQSRQPAGTGTPPSPVRAAPLVSALKWTCLGIVVLVAIYALMAMLPKGAWFGIVIVAAVAMGTLVIYASHRAVPAKYLYPGILLLVAFQIFPIFYTVSMAFTNYGDGHSITKAEAIAAIQRDSVKEVPGSPRYQLSVAVEEGSDIQTGDLRFLLVDPAGNLLQGTSQGLSGLSEEGIELASNGRIAKAPGFRILNASEVGDRKDLEAFSVPTKDGAIKSIGFSAAYEGRATVTYDEASDTLTDTSTGKVFRAVDAQWVADDGSSFPQGWRENVGFKNFLRVINDPTLRTGFVNILIWNILFAVISVVSTFLLGMFLALLFNNPRLKGKGVMRAVLILPYALPGFVTALVWGSMFNQDWGLINTTLGIRPDWLGDPTLAKIAILITNLWLGFPYMFIVCTGALQAISSDVKEAAKIDGATGLQSVLRITMPLLLVAVGPLLIASFSFNFNNFTLIYLLTAGGPMDAVNTKIGSTDLLITYAFRLAFGGVGNDYGFASAVSIFIFFIVATLSAVGFSRTKALEEVH